MIASRHAFTALGLVMIAVTITMSWTAAVPLALFGAAAVTYLLWSSAPRWAAALLYAACAASIVAVYWIDSHATPIGLFLLAALVALREPRRILFGLLVLAGAAHSTVQLALGDPWLDVLATDAGILFFALIGRLLITERSQRERIAALLLEVEQSREAERVALAEAERARMARDLHDVLAHTLSGLAIQLEAVRILSASSEPALREAAERAHRLSRAGLQEARRAVATLRGDELPGPELLGALVEEHRLSSSGPVRLTVSGAPSSLAPDAGLAIYRTAQEALSNVRKHAAGAAVLVALEWGADEVVLTVSDSGGAGAAGTIASGSVAWGTVASGTVASGYGLAGMSERAEALGAVLSFGPADGGFRVRLAVPLG